MDKYKRLILRGQEKISGVFVLDREIKFNYEYLNLNKIISFIWPRRAWKTYFMFSILKKLIKEKKIDLEQIIFIDFTSFLYEDFNIEQLLEDFFQLYPNKKPFFVFDEIQELNNFSKIVMFLFNNDYKIFLSGSNSKLLSSELSTIFRWRTIDVNIYPLNFDEFLYFKKIQGELSCKDKKDHSELEINNIHTEKEVWIFKNLLTEFLEFWSYPEIVLSTNKETKYELIKSYFTLLLYKDLLERYWIENEYTIKYLIRKLLLSVTKEFNINKIFNELKSQNIKIWKQTIYNYLEYLKEIFFIKEIFDEFKKWSKKFFFYDIWYNNILLLENLWQRFENIVFSELNRTFSEVVYRKTNNYEIDFIIKEESIAVQVCYELTLENIEREIKWFSENNFKNNFLVYFNKEKDFEILWVKIVNFYEFWKIILSKNKKH